MQEFIEALLAFTAGTAVYALVFDGLKRRGLVTSLVGVTLCSTAVYIIYVICQEYLYSKKRALVQKSDGPSPTDVALDPLDGKDSGNVYFLLALGGGGHKAAAMAVRECLIAEDVKWNNEIKVIDAAKLVERMTLSGGSNLFDGDAWYTPALRTYENLRPSAVPPRPVPPVCRYNWFMKRGFYRTAAICGHSAMWVISLRRRTLEKGFEEC